MNFPTTQIKKENAQVATLRVKNVDTEVSNAIILPLTKAVICSPEKKENKTKAYVLFDIGSQRSFVTEHLAKKLQLKVLGTEELMLRTFAAHRPQRCYLPKAEWMYN